MPAITANDVLTAVGFALKDEEHIFWTPSFLLDALNDSVRQLRHDIPESKLDDSTGNEVTYAKETRPTTTLCVSDHWLNHLVERVAWKAFARDMNDKKHEIKAAEHKANWIALGGRS